MKENLTPRSEVRYSINRVEDTNTNSGLKPVDNGVSTKTEKKTEKPTTHEQQKQNKERWDKAIARANTADEKVAMVALKDSNASYLAYSTRKNWEAKIALASDPDEIKTLQKAMEHAVRVVENAELSPEDRIKKAEEILGRTLSEKEKSTILAAHDIGAGEEGKSGEQAEVFNYTQEQIAKKARVLKDGGFDSGDRRLLLEEGIAGLPPEAFNDIDADTYTDEDVKSAASFVKGVGAQEDADSTFLQNQIAELNSRINSGAGNLNEARLLRTKLQSLATAALRQEAGNAQERAQRENPPPPEGVSINPAEFTDVRILNVAQEINEEIAKFPVPEGRGVPDFPMALDIGFLLREKEKIIRMLAEGGVDAAQANRLIENIDRWVDISKDAKEDLIDQINQAQSIDASHFPEHLLEYSIRFPEIREMLISKIYFKSFEDTTEANRYEINLYAGGNRDALLGFLERVDRPRYDYFIKLNTAAELFHGMNVAIVSGQMRDLQEYAKKINYEHFSLMQTMPGVPEVMRLYEEKYQQMLSKEGKILTDTYRRLKEEVERSFKELNKNGLVRSAYENERDTQVNSNGEVKSPWEMDDWELKRALNVGRAFYNLSFRAAENIAAGDLEGGGKQFRGFPQEHAVRLMSWLKWMARRFDIAPSRGGQDFLKRTETNCIDWMHTQKKKLGYNKIENLGGMDVRDLELSGAFGVSGVYSGWRMETMLVDNIRLNTSGKTIQEWLDEEVSWSGATVWKKEGSGHHVHWHDTGKTTQKRKEWISQIKDYHKNPEELAEILSPLYTDNTVALGYFIKNMFTGDVAYLARQKAWEKVAETNVPLMVNYLSNIKFEGGAKENRIKPAGWDDEIEVDVKNADGTSVLVDGITRKRKSTKWEEFTNRVMLDHAWKVKHNSVYNEFLAAETDEMRGIIQRRLAEVDGQHRRSVVWAPGEQELIERIKTEGKTLAPHLADIVFPYLPFMNDMPFETLNYAGPGETFYNRRVGSDLGSFSAGEGGFVAIMGNPGGIGAEEALKQFKEIVSGIEGPNGSEDAQDKVFPMFSAWGELVMTKGGQRQALVKAVIQAVRQPTSVAQEWAGMEADSFNEVEMLHVLGEAEKHGILSHELYNEMKKKKNLGLMWLIWMLIRDAGVFMPIIAGVQLTKGVTK